jgi:hypothetical protein
MVCLTFVEPLGRTHFESKKFARMVEAHWDRTEAYCHEENQVALGLVEGLNNTILSIPTTGLRLPGRGVFPAEDPHLHCCRSSENYPHDSQKSPRSKE